MHEVEREVKRCILYVATVLTACIQVTGERYAVQISCMCIAQWTDAHAATGQYDKVATCSNFRSVAQQSNAFLRKKKKTRTEPRFFLQKTETEMKFEEPRSSIVHMVQHKDVIRSLPLSVDCAMKVHVPGREMND